MQVDELGFTNAYMLGARMTWGDSAFDSATSPLSHGETRAVGRVLQRTRTVKISRLQHGTPVLFQPTDYPFRPYEFPRIMPLKQMTLVKLRQLDPGKWASYHRHYWMVGQLRSSRRMPSSILARGKNLGSTSRQLIPWDIHICVRSDFLLNGFTDRCAIFRFDKRPLASNPTR